MSDVKIIIVEDSFIIANDLQVTIETMGYQVVGIVSSGEQALVLSQQMQPDLAIMDIKLSGAMDGIETARRLMDNLNIPVIFLSAYSDKNLIERAKQTEPLGYLIKPYNEIELQTAIEIALYKIEMKMYVKECENQRLEIMTQQKLILDNVVTGIAFLKDRKFVWLNKYMEQTFGYSMEEVVGLTTERYYPSKEDFEEFGRQAYPFIAKGKSYYEERLMKHKDNTLFWCSLKGTAVNPDKLSEGYIWILQNIDEKKKMEEELRKAKEIAESASSFKSELLSSISHEIRTPMNAIMNMAKLISETDSMPAATLWEKIIKIGKSVLDIADLNSTQRIYAQIIRDSSDILLAQINDILDFSKIEAGKFELEIIQFNLKKIIEQVINLLRIKAEEKGLHLLYQIQSNICLNLWGDPLRLRQILLNLVSNATKFTDKGEIKIFVSLEKETDTDVYIRFNVSDTGIGIPKDLMVRLFKPFSQIDASTTRKFGGTGLGLSISKQLVEMMEGEIGVQSLEGEGSSFWFNLCFKKVDSFKEKVSLNQGLTKLTKLNLSSIRILLVEDDLFNQTVVSAIFSSIGLSPPDVAFNGRKAVEILEKKPYDLVFMDIEMPEMNGIEATKNIRNFSVLNKNIPIVALTGQTIKENRENFIKYGMNDYIEKPINPKELMAAIHRQFIFKQ